MKQPKATADSPPQPKRAGPQPPSLHAQTEATAGRNKVREAVPVRAPRESKRPVERTAKSRTGS